MSWSNIPIEQIAAVKGGKRLPKGHDFTDTPTDHFYVRARDIGDGKVQTNQLVHISEDTHSKISRYTIDEGDILITIVGANVGDVGYVSGEIAGANLTENAAKLVVDRTQFEPLFLNYFLASSHIKEKLSVIASGAAQGKLGLYKIKSFLVPNPPLLTQTKIVKIIANYDNLIQNNKRRIALLEDSARLLFNEWFVQLRFPGHEHSKIIDGVPEGWCRDTLVNFAIVKKGKNITRETVNTGIVPVVAGGLSPAYFHDTSNANGPVITVSASGANAGYVNLYNSDIWASDCSYFSVSDNPQVFILYCLLKTQQATITAMQKGAAQPHVYPKDLERVIVLWPNEALRSDFTQIVAPKFEHIKKLQDQCTALTKARNLLLPRLMDGRIEI